jgi:hypothetical protein
MAAAAEITSSHLARHHLKFARTRGILGARGNFGVRRTFGGLASIWPGLSASFCGSFSGIRMLILNRLATSQKPYAIRIALRELSRSSAGDPGSSVPSANSSGLSGK